MAAETVAVILVAAVQAAVKVAMLTMVERRAAAVVHLGILEMAALALIPVQMAMLEGEVAAVAAVAGRATFLLDQAVA